MVNHSSTSSALRLAIEKQGLLANSQLHLGLLFWHSYWGQLLDDKETFYIPAENQRQTIIVRLIYGKGEEEFLPIKRETVDSCYSAVQ